jgi:glutamate N-acetyltransferase/amino-acid N-acetyltransferase
VQVCGGGAAVPHDGRALAAAVAGDEVEYTVGLPGEGAEAEVFFSDLSHDYVTSNAEYTT